MRTALTIVLIILEAGNLLAQQVQTTQLSLPSIRTEAGVFGQTNFGANGDNMSVVGVQYKKMLNDKKGFRVIGGYSNYSSAAYPFSYSSAGDTTIVQSTKTNIGLAVLGVGAEMQRHFYKRVFLYAALEVRGGYGTGGVDSVIQKSYNTSGTSTYTLADKDGRANASMYYLGFMPSVGAKLQFNRITLGTELTGVDLAFKQVNVKHGSDYGVFDMSLGHLTQRVFVNYRF